MKIKIGIDIGGTFTHAAAIDSENLKLIKTANALTTHHSKEGIGEGVKICLDKLFSEAPFSINEIILLAFSTTQTTNALLEGDVCSVGIISVGKGLIKNRVKKETNLDEIELYEGKYLHTHQQFLDSEIELNETRIKTVIKNLVNCGAEVIVACEAFSVDNPATEDFIVDVATSMSIPATSTHLISQLYGLRARTRTAVLNASMIPIIIKSAEAVEKAIKEVMNIDLPIMVMRSDGGVMSTTEMKKRPILTLLSGPAAGISGALFYSKIYNGIFLEVGGTSTDISYINNGKVDLKDASISGQRLYLKTVNSHTVGDAGGSIPRISKPNDITIGPRSAHIAGMKYISYLNENDLDRSEVLISKPTPTDPANYIFLKLKDGSLAALTNTCMAIHKGQIQQNDYGWGNTKTIEKAISIISSKLKTTTESFINKWTKSATYPIEETIMKIIKVNKLQKDDVMLIGGGGGAKAIVPAVAEKLKMKFLITENYPTISAIGVALAMIKEEISKNVLDVNKEEILKIRMSAFKKLLEMGASPDNINVEIEIDKRKNILKAEATGSIDLKLKEQKIITIDEGKVIISNHSDVPIENINFIEQNPFYLFYEIWKENKKIFKLFKIRNKIVYVLDNQGLTKLIMQSGEIIKDTKRNALEKLQAIIRENEICDEGGKKLPEIIIFAERKKIDLTKLVSCEQVKILTEVELEEIPEDAEVFFLLKRTN